MRKLYPTLFFLLIFCSTVFTQQQYIIELNTDATPVLEKQLSLIGLELDDKIFNRPILYRVNSMTNTANDQMSALQAISMIKSVHRDQLLEERTTEPNDPLFPVMWHHEKVASSSAWDFAKNGITRNGDSIVLAIFDSGFELDHPDLRDILWKNKWEIPNDNLDNDNNGYIDDIIGVNLFTGKDNHRRDNHGTEVVGAMSANGNNSIGVAGITWNAKVIPMSKSVGGVFESDFIEAYNYTIDLRQKYNDSDGAEGAFIVAVNVSLGISGGMASDYPQWCAVYDEMGRHGIIGVNATENDNNNVDILGDMPTVCPSDYLIAVTNSNENDEKVANAAFGSTHVDLAAPGEDIYTTTLDHEYVTRSGTSLASPLVTGAIGLMYMAASADLMQIVHTRPQEAALIIRTLLLDNVQETPDLMGSVASNGRLNLGAAVRAAANYSSSNETFSLNLLNPVPHPVDASSRLVFEVPTVDPVRVTVFDMKGSVVQRYEISAGLAVGLNDYPLNFENLSSGLYHVLIQQNENQASKKFIKIDP